MTIGSKIKPNVLKAIRTNYTARKFNITKPTSAMTTGLWLSKSFQGVNHHTLSQYHSLHEVEEHTPQEYLAS